MKPLVKLGIGIASFGIIGMILISVISLLAYGKIYMYNGYAFTGVLWTICFVALGIGAFILVLNLAIVLHEKKSKLATPILIGLIIIALIVLLIVLFKACGALGGELKSNKDDTCGICGGSGVFQGERCWCVGRD